MSESQPDVQTCQAKWNDVHCERDGEERLIASKLPFSLSGMQMKFQAKQYHFCDECWPKARPFLMQRLGYSNDEVRKAAEEAGLVEMTADG